MLEGLIRLTNSENFIDNWAFFVTEISRPSRSGNVTVKLEALYDGFEERHFDKKNNWQLLCKNYEAHRLEMGYLRPFYQMKIYEDHPLIWNYQGEFYVLTVKGDCHHPLPLMEELFTVNNQASGGWTNFFEVFGFLPAVFKEQRQPQFSVPKRLVNVYAEIFQKYGMDVSWQKDYENDAELKVLLFSGDQYPDNQDCGQLFIVAEDFELLNSA